MMIQPPSLQLRDISLSRTPAGKHSVAAVGDVIRDETPVSGVPPFRLGVGQAVAVPPAVSTAFAEYDVTVEEADFGLWLETVNDSIGNPVWYGVFTPEGMELFGVHTLQATALSLPDSFGSLDVADLQLRVALQVRGMTVQRALIVVAGQVQSDLKLGPISVEGLDVRFGLHIDIANLASLSAMLDQPEAILDAAFTGRFAFSVDGQKLSIVDDSLLSIDDASMRFGIAVSSVAGERELLPGDAVFSLQAASLQLLGTTLSHLELACGYEADHERVFMEGSADAALPSLFDNILDSAHPSTGTAIRSAFAFEHTSNTTELILALDHLTLDPAINFLELAARDLHLGFRYESHQWELKLSGATCQSWSRIARRMAEAQIVRMPGGDNLPDVQGKLDFTLSDSGSRFHYRLDFLKPDTGCRTGVVPVPFSGPLGSLPVNLADSYLEIEFDVNSSASPTPFTWSFSGGGELSTTGWLHEPLPLDEVRFSFQALSEGDEMPELVFRIDQGLPSLNLPPLLPGTGDIKIFEPQTLAMRMGDTLVIDGTAAIPNPAGIVDQLCPPGSRWEALLTQLFDPIEHLLTGMDATLAVVVPVTGNDPATLRLTLQPTDAPRFGLMETLGALIAAGQPGDVDESKQIKVDEEDEFFEVQPGRIEFVVSMDEALSLALSLSFDCKLFGESFDLTALLRVVDGEPEFLLMAGVLDPIRLAIPGITPEDVLGGVDVTQVVNDYNLNQHFARPPFPGFYELFPYAAGTDAEGALQELERLFHTLFASPGVDTSLVFEIRNFGLSVRLDQAPSVSGTIRLVQLPGFLDRMMPEKGFDFGLGCSTQRLFISVKGPGADDASLFENHTTDPLLSIPLGRDGQGRERWVHLYFGRFELEYSWVTHAFGFVLDAAVIPEPADLGDFNTMGSGIYIPAQKTFVKLSKVVATGKFPIIIPEWAISYKREGIGTEVVETAADEMGFQYYLGNPLDNDERLATVYFRETRFSPTYYLMQPGLSLDGGFIVGSHRPRDYRYDSASVHPPQRYDDMFIELTAEPGDQLVAHVEINNWQFILMHASLGLMLNPMAVLAPGSPMPPFWISPLHLLMGDVFADRMGLSVNVPHLLFFGVSFSRPLPALSLNGMMELAALAMTGFSETIPHTSELRQVYYATLDIRAKLPLLASLIGDTPELSLSMEANIVDVINGLIRLSEALQDTIQNGQELVSRLLADPSLLVRMIPAQARRFELDVSHGLLRFEFGGSLYVLTPEEFEEELILYHENERSRRGLAASNPHGTKGNRIQLSSPSGPVPFTVSFSAAATGDTVLGHTWDFGEGGTSTSATPTHTYALPGSYTVTLRTQVRTADNEEREIVSTVAVVATGVAVNDQPLELTKIVREPFRYVADPLSHFDPAEETIRNYIGHQIKQVAKEQQDNQLALTNLRNQRDAALGQFIQFVWSKIENTKIGDSQQRAHMLHQYGLSNTMGEQLGKELQQAISALPSRPGSSWLQMTLRQAPSSIRAMVQSYVTHRMHRELTTPYTVITGLAQSPYALAESIVAGTVLDQPSVPLIRPLFRRLSPTVSVGVGFADDSGTPGGGGIGLQAVTLHANPSFGQAPLTVNFSATVIAGGLAPVQYNWSFGDGSTSSGSAPSHTYPNAGSYPVSLAVALSDGTTLVNATTVIVSTAPLILSLTATPNSGTAPLTVQFHVEAQTGASFVWLFGDGSHSTEAHPVHEYVAPGAYTASVTVTVAGHTESASVSVAVAQPVSIVRIVERAERSTTYTTHLPDETGRRGVMEIEACYAPWITQVQAGQIDTGAKAAALRASLTECIAEAIISQYPTTTDALKDTSALVVPERAVTRELTAVIGTRPTYVMAERTLTLFDGRRTRNLLATHIATDRQPEPIVETVPEVHYEIRGRPEFVPDGETPTLAIVPTSSPLYQVVTRADRAYLLVEGNGDGVAGAEILLPEWATDSIPPSPLAADLIRARLRVEQVIVHRPLTDAERAYSTHAFIEAGDRLYQQSIFARSEYTLRDEGGVHGPLSIADLLRNRSGYIVPRAPLWLSGVKLHLLDSIDIGMAGLLAAPDNIFLHGYHELELEWGITRLSLQGEFHLIAGEMWEAALDGSDEFQANSLQFSGAAELVFDNKTIFKGQASGTLSVPENALPVFNLKVKVEYHDSWTLEFNNTELVKATLDAILDLDVVFNPNSGDEQFALTLQGALPLMVQVATPRLEEVTLAPARTVCAPVPIFPVPVQPPYFENECVTLPAITAQVPVLTGLTWHIMEFSSDPSLKILVGDGGSDLSITLAIAASWNDLVIDQELVLTDLYN